MTTLRLDGLSRTGEPEAEAPPVCRPPVAERLRQIDRRIWKAPALILDLDADTCIVTMCGEPDSSSGTRKVTRVVQEVRHGGRKELRIGVDGQFGIHRVDRDVLSSMFREEAATRGNFVQERRNPHPFASVLIRGDPDVREG